MIVFIRGQLLASNPLSATIDVGGLGYQVFIPTSTFSKLPQIGEKVSLHTSLVIRENAQHLYGFFTAQERDLFEQVTGVSGIGPKTAISLLGHLPPEDFQTAITTENSQAISRVPGIGKKSAQRLIIELRDRLFKSAQTASPSDFAIPMGGVVSDAVNALINLGYNQQAAQKAITKSLKNLPESTDLPTLISDALKNV